MSTSVTQLIGSFYDRLGADVRAGLTAPATVDWYRWQLAKLTAVAGDVAAAELRPRHIVSLRMTHHLARGIKRLFTWAVEEDFLEKNWFTKLRVPRCGRRKRIFTAAEIIRLYRSAPPSFRVILFFLLNTAARPGEIRTLRWSDVDLEKRLICLGNFKAKDRRADELETRSIPLSHVVCRRLERMKRAAVSGTVFNSDRTGKPYSYNALRCLMRRTREKAGLLDGGEKAVLYTLRHTAATILLRQGVDLMTLSRILGHTTLEMTKRYLHLDDSDLIKAIDKASQSGT